MVFHFTFRLYTMIFHDRKPFQTDHAFRSIDRLPASLVINVASTAAISRDITFLPSGEYAVANNSSASITNAFRVQVAAPTNNPVIEPLAAGLAYLHTTTGQAYFYFSFFGSLSHYNHY